MGLLQLAPEALSIDDRMVNEKSITGIDQAGAQVLLGPYTFRTPRGSDGLIGQVQWPVLNIGAEMKSNGVNFLTLEVQENRDGAGFPGTFYNVSTTSATYVTKGDTRFDRNYFELASTVDTYQVRVVGYMTTAGSGTIKNLLIKGLLIYTGPNAPEGISQHI